MVKLLIVLFVTFQSFCALADIYQCTDSSGKAIFTDMPCERKEHQTVTAPQTKPDINPTVLLTNTPNRVRTAKDALEFIGRNQIVTMNLDRLEQNYILTNKPANFFQAFDGDPSLDNSYSNNKHTISAKFANGVGEIIYKSSTLKSNWLDAHRSFFFNISFDDINSRLMELGLKDKSLQGLQYGYARWRWKHRVFTCDAKADFEADSYYVSFEVRCIAR
ncbi:hypothetical protein GCM10007978_17060 [Shewanella hanedai]|uniref:DUF4124 domain-containing protein n=1 Tax=Shewanella hanedai TaxID=25 RepID=A0A553JSK4_SHEHA|nr:DUF4124 domain-containing protein [Shewanella hanedai]TRY15442.1 DUF4124 domain-containing protein [Shewanella hanedai]GGI79836.1 hypothetical protein GCM10007978_17060 [Shewanella hanedai]